MDAIADHSRVPTTATSCPSIDGALGNSRTRLRLAASQESASNSLSATDAMKRKLASVDPVVSVSQKADPESPDGTNLLALPDDVLVHILGNLYPDHIRELAYCMVSCKLLHKVGNRVLDNVEVCDRRQQPERHLASALMWIFEKSPNLVVLKTMAWGSITAFPSRVPRLVKLTSLELRALRISHKALTSLFYDSRAHQPNLPNLKTLTLTNLRLAGEKGKKWLRPLVLPYLSSLTITWLKYLSLRGCAAIADSITGRLYNIEDLDVAFTALSDNGLDVLHYGCPSLRQLTVAYMQKNNWPSACWTQSGLETFKKRRPDVKVKFAHC